MKIEKKEVKVVTYNLELSPDELIVLTRIVGNTKMIAFEKQWGQPSVETLMRLFKILEDQLSIMDETE